MKKTILIKSKIVIMVFLVTISLSAFGQTTIGPFTFYPTNQGGTMQGQAQIEGLPASSGDIIAAFDPGGECVGAALLTIYQGTAYINFVIYGDDGSGHGMSTGEAFTLKLYDASTSNTFTYATPLSGWQNTNFAPMPGFNNPGTIYNFNSCMLSVAPSNRNVTAAAGSTTFTVTSDCVWTASSNQTWCAISPASYTGNGTITAIYTQNTSINPRTANITITVAGITPVVVTVTQAGAACLLTVSPSNQNVSSASGTTTFTVTSNSSWSVSESENWLSASPTSGTGNGSFIVTYDANTGAQRIGNISVSAAGCTTVNLTVTQAATGVQVSLPTMNALPGTTIEIPITVSDVTGLGIISLQFAFSYDPSILMPVSPFVATTGTIIGNAGWTAMYNTNIPGQITIGSITMGSILSGSGTLIKAVFNVLSGGSSSSPLNFINFIFNAGNPPVVITNGLLKTKFCGDADENGLVQVYDAALTLQHAIALITLPAGGVLNADVYEDGQITALDAALTCQHAIGISPLSFPTCFTVFKGIASLPVYDFPFVARLSNIEKYPDYTTANIVFEGIVRPQTVFAINMDVYSPEVNLTELQFVDLPGGYIHFINQMSTHVYRIGIINPSGMLSQDLKIRLKIKEYAPNAMMSIRSIIINEKPFPDIVLSGDYNAGFSTPSQSLSAYPNPFSSSITTLYEVGNASQAELHIVDLFGRVLETLVNEIKEKGVYQKVWNGQSANGKRVSQGWYLIRLKTHEGIQQTRICMMN